MDFWRPTSIEGVYERFVDGDGSTFHVEKVQDVAPIIERNKRLQTQDDGWNATRDGRRIASVPLVIWQRWLKEGLDPRDEKALRRKLNDPEWRWLRTSEGRL